MEQVFKIMKTTNHTYYKVENKINELIKQGAIIESVSPVVINQHFSESRKFAKETEMLVYVLYKEGSGNLDKDSK